MTSQEAMVAGPAAAAAGPSTMSSPAPNLSIHGPALSGWQFHQSHGQVTVVFYVALSARDEDLDVLIASDHVVAGIRGYPPVLKASLYARIDPSASSWQLERNQRSTSRRPHRSGSRSRRQTSGSGHDDTSSSEGRNPTSVASSSSSMSPPQTRQRTGQNSSSGTASSGAQARSTAGSSTGRSASRSGSTSSYELLGNSRASLPPRPPSPTPSTGSGVIIDDDQSHGRSEPASSAAGVTDSTIAPASGPASSPSSPSSPRSPHSVASRISTGPSTSSSDPEEIFAPLSLEGSVHFGTAASSGSGRPSSHDGDDDAMHARLVTVHLTKIDVGMWPSLISGPAPLSPEHARGSVAIPSANAGGSERRRSSDSSEEGAMFGSSPSSAISSSLDSDTGAGGSWQRRGRSGTRMSAAESTLSLHSDDSHTVLGYGTSPRSMTTATDQQRARRGAGGQDEESEGEAASTQEEDARFNMDPVSLVLIGLQARASMTAPPPPGGWDDGFEYFVRSWRTADLPTATRLLVQDYLPLPFRETREEEERAEDDPPTAPPRMVAALGGRKALARLYVSYARLSLTSVAGGNASLSGIGGLGKTGGATTSTSGGATLLFPSGSGHCRDPYTTYAPARYSRAQSGGAAHSPPPPIFSSPSSANSPPLHSPPMVPYVNMSEAQRVVQQGPLPYLSEALRLDAGIGIEASEWAEAGQIAQMAALEVEAERAADEAMEEQGVDEEDGGGFFAFPGTHGNRRRRGASPSAAGTGRRSREEAKSKRPHKARRSAAAGEGEAKDPRRKARRGNATAAAGKGAGDILDENGFVVNVLSGAALVSFVVAGSVAVLGWWKRGPGAASAGS